jgi:hypothetical protein
MTLDIIKMNNDNTLYNVLIIYSQKVYTMHSRTIYLVTITYIMKNITSHKKMLFSWGIFQLGQVHISFKPFVNTLFHNSDSVWNRLFLTFIKPE